MPYIIVEGNLEDNQKQTSHQFTTSVCGLKADEIKELINFAPGPSRDNYTISFYQHPCVILNALEVLGFQIVTSTSRGQESTLVWTMKKEFSR